MSFNPVGRILATVTAADRERPVAGLATARVVKIEDDGTYRLHIMGMSGQDDDDESSPARVMMPMAGAGRGMHFFPEKGDEVVIGFQSDSTNVPIILGAVWNSESRPPDQARESAQNDVRTIVSRSGHELTFDDAAGQGKVRLKTAHGHELLLDDTPAGLKVSLSSKGGRSVVMDDVQQKLSVVTPTCQVTMQDPGVLSIQATVSISLQAPSISINGTTVTMTSAAGSSIIDGSPYKLHRHRNPAETSLMTGGVMV